MTAEARQVFLRQLALAHDGRTIKIRRAAMRTALGLLGACEAGKRRALVAAHKSWPDAWNAASAFDLQWFISSYAREVYSGSDSSKMHCYFGALRVVETLSLHQPLARRAELLRRVFTSDGALR